MDIEDEILEFIPNEGEPYLVKRPKDIEEHKEEDETEKVEEEKKVTKVNKTTSASSVKEDVLFRSMDLDNSFVEERGNGVIEENEVLVRGEWKQECKEEEEEEEYEEYEEDEEEYDDGDEMDKEEDKEDKIKETNVKTGHSCDYCGKNDVKYDFLHFC